MPRKKTERIQDAAQAALKAGDYKKTVDLSAAAYVELLRSKPHMMKGEAQFRNVMFFPRLGVHLVVTSDGGPEVVYDREKFIFSEAVTYFEFAVDNLGKAGV